MARSKKIKSMTDKLTKGNVGVGRYSFSKARLLIFALVFAGIGGYFLWQTFAATSASRYVYCIGDPAWNPTGTPGWWLGSASSTGWTRSSGATAAQRVYYDDSVSVMESVNGSYGATGTSGPCRTAAVRIDPDDPPVSGVAAGAQASQLLPYYDLYTNPYFGPPPDARPQQGQEWWYGFAAKTNPGYIAHGQITPDLTFGSWNSFGLEFHQTIGQLGPVMQEITTMTPNNFSTGPAGNKWWTCSQPGGWTHISQPRIQLALTAGLNDSVGDDANHTCRRIMGPVFEAGRLYKSIYQVKWDAFNNGSLRWWVDSGDGQGYVKYADWTGVSTLYRAGSNPDTGTWPTLLNYRKTDISLPSSIMYYGGFVRGSTMTDVAIP